MQAVLRAAPEPTSHDTSGLFRSSPLVPNAHVSDRIEN